MPITKTDLGIHKDVTWVAFGGGDIMITPAIAGDKGKTDILLFAEGSESVVESVMTIDFIGKSTNEMPNVKVVFSFSGPLPIATLIHQLIELQETMLNRKPKNHK